MKMITFTEEEGASISEKLDRIEKKLEMLAMRPKDDYLTQVEALKFFGIKERLLRQWRDNGILAFSKLSSKTYIYKWPDVERLLRENHHPAFALKKESLKSA